MSEQAKQTVQSVTTGIIRKLAYQVKETSNTATLVKFRKSVGKPLSEATEVWQILFENLPEEFLSSYNQPSHEEIAIYTTIQLYALHQQGASPSVMMKKNKKSQNIGASLRELREDSNTTAIDRRFNVMITSSTFEELVYHLRHLITLLKSRKPDVEVDYPRLAEDLCWFLRNAQDNVRLNWAQSYYKQYARGEENNDN